MWNPDFINRVNKVMHWASNQHKTYQASHKAQCTLWKLEEKNGIALCSCLSCHLLTNIISFFWHCFHKKVFQKSGMKGLIIKIFIRSDWLLKSVDLFLHLNCCANTLFLILNLAWKYSYRYATWKVCVWASIKVVLLYYCKYYIVLNIFSIIVKC